ncbi:MAG: hypothetical protein WC360_06070 [Opitutales bacterium]|jgi:hypothetical protein
MELLLVLLAAYLLITPAAALILALRKKDGPGAHGDDIEDMQERLRLLRLESMHLAARVNRLEHGQADAEAPAQTQHAAAPVAQREPFEAAPLPMPSAESLYAAYARKTHQGAKEDEREGPLFAFPAMGEVNLMKWWLPRIGGALAILALLFFGIYINRGMPPLPRLLEMAGVSLGMIAGGTVLERRQRMFGGIVVMVGVVMCYLTSFAAYAFKPVQVIDDPKMGALLQLGVLGAIVLFGLARRSRDVVLAAFIMVWPMMAFMTYAKLGDLLLVSSAMLCVTGVLLPVAHKRFSIIPWVALPIGAASMILLAVFMNIASTPNAYSALGYLAIISLLIPVAGTIPRWKAPFHEALATAGTALAGIAAYVYFDCFFDDYTGKAFLVVSIACVVGALTQRVWSKGWSSLALIYTVKASALASLWIITDYADYTRWAALLVQATAMGILGRREKKPFLLGTAVATALASVAFFVFSGKLGVTHFGLSWNLMAIYPPMLAASLAWMLKANIQASEDENLIHVGAAIIAFLVPLLSISLQSFSPIISGNAPASMLLLATLPLALSFIPGISSTALRGAAGMYYLMAALWFCKTPQSAATLAAMLGTTAAIIAVVLSGKISIQKTLRTTFRYIAFTVAVCVTAAWTAQQLSLTNWLLGGIALEGIILVTLSRIRGMDELRMFTLLAPLFIIRAAFELNIPSLFAAPLWLLAVAYLRNGKPERRIAESIAATIAGIWLLILTCGADNYMREDGYYLMALALAASGGLMLAIARAKRLNGPGLTGLIVMATTLVLLIDKLARKPSDDASAYAMTAALLIGATIPALYLYQRRAKDWNWQGIEKIIPAALALLNWSAFAMPLVNAGLVPPSWDTPLLALDSCALVVFGIALKARPYPLIGLLTLCVPAYRLFVYDLDEPLQRIGAFGIGGLLIMTLGYLYHRMSTDTNTREEPPKQE